MSSNTFTTIHSKTKTHTHSKTQTPKKTETIQIPRDKLGLVIGNLSSIGRYVGQGCHISFLKGGDGRARPNTHDTNYTFTIEGWGLSVGRAKNEIQTLLAPRKVKKTVAQPTRSQSTSAYGALQDSDSDSDSEDTNQAKSQTSSEPSVPMTRHEQRLANNAAKKHRAEKRDLTSHLGFKDTSGIAQQKKQGWERATAYRACEQKWKTLSLDDQKKTKWEEFKKTHMDVYYASVKTNSSMTTHPPVPSHSKSYPASETATGPTFTTTPVKLGAWGKPDTMKGVMNEEPVIKPIVVKTTKLDVITRGGKVIDGGTITQSDRFKPNCRPTLVRMTSATREDSWDETDELSAPPINITAYTQFSTPDDWDDSEFA